MSNHNLASQGLKFGFFCLCKQGSFRVKINNVVWVGGTAEPLTGATFQDCHREGSVKSELTTQLQNTMRKNISKIKRLESNKNI